LEDKIIMSDKKCFKLTKEGLEYIKQETKEIYENPKYKNFLKIVNKLIDKEFGKKSKIINKKRMRNEYPNS